MRQHIPNFLTFLRIALVPVIIACFFFPSPISDFWVGTIFIVAAVTDFLDGYFARILGSHSRLGQFFDPIADKLLVAVTLFMLAGSGRLHTIHLIPGVIILSRELIVSGLREFLGTLTVPLPVSYLAKWKTGIQMTSLSLILLTKVSWLLLPLDTIGIVGLWIAAALTIRTGWDYLRVGLKTLNED